MVGSPEKAHKPYGFSRNARILKKADFQNVFANGRKHYSPQLVIYSLANGLGEARMGMAVGRKVGKSVRRSRIKRLLREAFRCGRQAWPALDIVVVARPGASDLTLEMARQRLDEVFQAKLDMRHKKKYPARAS